MNWNSWPEFFHMGGYALYVWGSYAVMAALIVGELVMLRMRRQKALQMAKRSVRYGKVESDESTT